MSMWFWQAFIVTWVFKFWIDWLHLQMSWLHLTYSWHLMKEVSVYLFAGGVFHTFGLIILTLIPLQVEVLWLLTIKSYHQTLAFSSVVNLIFLKTGFRLLAVWNISIASCFILLTYIVGFWLISKKVP